MSSLTRRDFIRNSMAVGAGLALATPFSRARGANNDIRLAVIGVGGKGGGRDGAGGHCASFRELKGVRLVAVCDADQTHVDRSVQSLGQRGTAVKGYRDLREVLDDKNIDAISVATPNHWHALIAVWACQAGKDVYLEKPISHEIWEGRKIVEAARKYKRIVQTGTQNRSDVGLREVIPYIQEGNLGKILWVRALCYKQRNSLGKVAGPQTVPASVDYNLWCGPAEMTPLRRRALHYDWHWVWNTGNGDIGNQGAHEMDVARWTIGQTSLPPRVVCIGGRLGYDDDGQTANTQIALLDYKPAPIIFEVRGLPSIKGARRMDRYRVVDIGNIIQCENGYFAGGRGGGWVYDNDGNRIKQFAGDSGGGHARNFIDAVRSRKIGDLHADILEGHVSAALSHIANTSYRIGSKASVDEIKSAVGNNVEFMDSFDRMVAHLQANEVDLEQTPLTLGPALTIDADTERYVGAHSDWANMYIKRNYREPFAVPEQV